MSIYNQIELIILTPVYNVSMYLDKCISSVISQTYSNFKLVLVDDGSTDGSGEICDLYSKEDSRIVVIHQENLGLINARQNAIKYVSNLNIKDRNIFCIFLDSDDYLKENALLVIVNTIQKYNCDLLIYGYETILNGNVIYSTYQQNNEIIIPSNKKEFCNLALISNTYNSLCRKAVKFELLHGRDYSEFAKIRMGEDLLQSIDLYVDCIDPLVIPDILYCYNVNPNSITRSITVNEIIDDFITKQIVIEKLKKNLIWSNDELEKYKKKCINQYQGLVKKIIYNNQNIISKRNILSKIASHEFSKDFIFHNSTFKDGLIIFLMKYNYFYILLLLFYINYQKIKLFGLLKSRKGN